MAYAFVTGSKGTGFQGASTGALNFTGVDLIVIHQVFYGLSPTHSVSDSLGNTYTALTSSGVNTQGSQLFYKQGPTVSSSMTFTPGNGAADIYVAGFSGSTATPFDVQNQNTNTSSVSIQAGSITPGINGELVVIGMGGYNNGVPSNGDPNFNLLNANGFLNAVHWGGGLWYSIQTSAAAVNPTISWSGTASDASACIASFKAAAATGKLFLPPSLSGLGSGGPFFSDRLAS